MVTVLVLDTLIAPPVVVAVLLLKTPALTERVPALELTAQPVVVAMLLVNVSLPSVRLLLLLTAPPVPVVAWLLTNELVLIVTVAAELIAPPDVPLFRSAGVAVPNVELLIVAEPPAMLTAPPV